MTGLAWVPAGPDARMEGAEHYVAESGWLLARIQRGPGNRGWLWSVSTHKRVLAKGEIGGPDDPRGVAEDYKTVAQSDLALAKDRVVLAINQIYNGSGSPIQYATSSSEALTLMREGLLR